MPLLFNELFIKKKPPRHLRDGDEVFFCDLTDEVFIDYEEFCDRIYLCNSMVWTCALSGKTELTYVEALESESEARLTIQSFPEKLKVPALYLASAARKLSFSQLVDDVYLFMKNRYFIGEHLEVHLGETARCECVVRFVHEPKAEDICNSPNKIRREKFFPPPAFYHYRIEKIVHNDVTYPVCDVGASQIRRKKGQFTKENLRLFLKQYTALDTDGVLVIEDQVLHEYGIESENFHHIFVGNLPNFALGQNSPRNASSMGKCNGALPKSGRQKPKSHVKRSQQGNCGKEEIPSRNRTLSKTSGSSYDKLSSASLETFPSPEGTSNVNKKHINGNNKQRIGAKVKERLESLEEKIQINKEGLQQKSGQKEEKSQQKRFSAGHNRLREDLECVGLKELPVPEEVRFRIPNECFGEFVMVLEFVNSFNKFLKMKCYTQEGISFNVLERALVEPAVSGPLNDIVSSLLKAVFELQEKDGGDIVCRDVSSSVDICEDKTISKSEKQAAAAYRWSELYQGITLTNLILDSGTLSEVLRLHLLSSGAKLDDSNTKYYKTQQQQRDQLRNREDPGLMLRMKYPHILRDLKRMHVSELSIKDKLTILSCLINQVLTYSSVRKEIDDRAARVLETRSKIKSLKGTLASPVPEFEHDHLKEKHEQEMSRMREMLGKRVAQVLPLLHSYQLLPLGSDRGHRRYWRFSSLPGLFVEWDPCETGACLSRSSTVMLEPVQSYVKCIMSEDPKRGKENKKDLRQLPLPLFLTSPPKKEGDVRKSNKECNMSEPPVSFLPGSQAKMSVGKNVKVVITGEDDWSDSPFSPLLTSAKTTPGGNSVTAPSIKKSTPVPMYKEKVDVWRCTKHQGSAIQWFFFSKVDAVSSLINCLHPHGFRESKLRKALMQEAERLREGIGECPKYRLNPQKFIAPNDAEDKGSEDALKLPSVIQQNGQGSSETKGSADDAGPAGEIPVSVVLELKLRHMILELEENLRKGCMGSLKVKDRDKWRVAIENNGYDPLCDELTWGPAEENLSTGEEDAENGSCGTKDTDTSVEAESDASSDLASEKEVYKKRNAGEIKGSSSRRRIFNLTESDNIMEGRSLEYKIKDIASAILQIEQSLPPQCLRRPLGNAGSNQVQRWEESLMNCCSLSQLFVHMSSFSKSINWQRSALNLKCTLCKKTHRGHVEKRVRCIVCRYSHDIACTRPNKKVSPAEWLCPKCGQRSTSKPAAENIATPDESQDGKGRQKGPKNAKVCAVMDSGDDVIQCGKCYEKYHCLCHVHSAKAKSGWLCYRCQTKATVKNEHSGSKKRKSMESEVPRQEDRKINKKLDSREDVLKKSEQAGISEEELAKDRDGDGEKIEKLSKESTKGCYVFLNISENNMNRDEEKVLKQGIMNGKSEEEEELSEESPECRVFLDQCEKDRNKQDKERMKDVEKHVRGTKRKSMEEEKPREMMQKEQVRSKNDEQIPNGEDNKLKEKQSPRQNEKGMNKNEQKRGRKRKNEVVHVSPKGSPNKMHKSVFGRRSQQRSNEDREDVTLVRRVNRTSGGGLSLDWGLLQELLDGMMHQEDAWPFLRPVLKSEAVDYHIVIKKPMDLGTMKNKLNMMKYRNNNEFLADAELVFANCTMYNRADTIEYSCGKRLAKYFSQRCSKLGLTMNKGKHTDPTRLNVSI